MKFLKTIVSLCLVLIFFGCNSKEEDPEHIANQIKTEYLKKSPPKINEAVDYLLELKNKDMILKSESGKECTLMEAIVIGLNFDDGIPYESVQMFNKELEFRQTKSRLDSKKIDANGAPLKTNSKTKIKSKNKNIYRNIHSGIEVDLNEVDQIYHKRYLNNPDFKKVNPTSTEDSN